MNAPSHPWPPPPEFGPDQELPLSMVRSGQPPRPAWVEIDLTQLRRNLALIRSSLPEAVRWLAVVKDDAYGHGLVTVAREAIAAGATFLGVATLSEGAALRDAGIEAPILLMGERHPNELPYCLEYRLRISSGDLHLLRHLDQLTCRVASVIPIHLKVNTGMNRYGVCWDAAGALAQEITQKLPGLWLEGVMSHFSMSDETDKSFAHEQIRRFTETLRSLNALGVPPGIRHLCNTGGFLDLPTAHFDLVRLGILPTGVYPSAVCRRLPDLQPIMSVKARIVSLRTLEPGEIYGYGLRYRANTTRRIGVLPLGYGDGYPRLRNTGHVLVRGRRAPIIGGVAMDAIGIDLTDTPDANLYDEAVLMGTQGDAVVGARDLAAWSQTVCYDILAGWRHRLPRISVNDSDVSASRQP